MYLDSQNAFGFIRLDRSGLLQITCPLNYKQISRRSWTGSAADLYEAGRRPGQRDGGHRVLVRQQPQHVAVRAEGDGVDARDPQQGRAHALVQAPHLHNNTWVGGEHSPGGHLPHPSGPAWTDSRRFLCKAFGHFWHPVFVSSLWPCQEGIQPARRHHLEHIGGMLLIILNNFILCEIFLNPNRIKLWQV